MTRIASTVSFLVRSVALTACVAACAVAPEEHGGVNTALLDSGFAAAARQPNLTSLVVVRAGVVERQAFPNGGSADSAQDIRSVTKSVVSLLVGMALDRGCLRSLDQTLADLLGPLAPADAAKRVITLRQLLTMTSGLGGNELADPNLYNQWALASNQLTYVWGLPLVTAPGTAFNYYSANYYIVSRILTRNCGQGTADFARDALFTPLGIGLRVWEADDSGYTNGGAGLGLTPMDMVAIGKLVLAGGRGDSGRIVSSAWVGAATTATVFTTVSPGSSAYGYGWWIGQVGETPYVMANGWGGQFIFVVPREQLIVVATQRWQGLSFAVANAQWQAVYDLILQDIVPAY